jgi:hypothetical protein
MKTKLLPVVCCVLLTCYTVSSNAQNANRTLSNLTSPTAVNQSLIPGTNNTINLGSGGRGGINWKNLYLGNALYLDGEITIYAPHEGNFFAGINAGNESVENSYNTGIGQFSLSHVTTGGWNTAVGLVSLNSNTVGSANSALGAEALNFNTGGHDNTANGYFSLYYNAMGSGNTAVGANALYNNTGGNYNTALGAGAGTLDGNLSNATALGAGAFVDASDKVRVGDGSVKSIGGQVGWSIFSDGRYKKDIKENVQGLAFINSLRPITYTVNIQGLNQYYNKGRKQPSNNTTATIEGQAMKAEIIKSVDEASKIVYSGFVAQEVEQAAKKLNFQFSGVDKPQSKDGLYGLRYDNFVVPLVKAVQELSKSNDDLQQQNNDLKKRMERLEAMMNVGQSSIKLSDASLAQNVPNPFTGKTTISFNLPQKFTTAQIIITDRGGKQLKRLSISGSGSGIVNIDAATLASGAYNYSLIVDGRIISSRQMIVGN